MKYKFLFFMIFSIFLLVSCEDSKKGVYVNEPLILKNDSSYLTETCGPDIYPCPPYGNRQYQTVKDIAFLPANNAASSLGDESGIVYLHDFYNLRQEGYKLLLVTTSTGWCTHCEAQMESVKSVINSHGSGSSNPQVAFLIVITEDQSMDPATLEYAGEYSSHHQLDDIVPITNDENKIFHGFMTTESYPFNFFIDLNTMQIIAYSSSLDTPEVFSNKLDEILATLN